MAKRKHLNLYSPNTGGGKGGFSYTGDYHVPALQGKSLRWLKMGLLLQCLIQLILLYFIGRSDPGGLRTLYVMPFFLVLFFFTGRSLLAALGLFSWEDKMTQSQYEMSWLRYRHGQAGMMASCGLLVMADLLMVLLGAPIRKELVLLALSLPIIALSALCHHYVKNVSCTKKPLSLTSEK